MEVVPVKYAYYCATGNSQPYLLNGRMMAVAAVPAVASVEAVATEMTETTALSIHPRGLTTSTTLPGGEKLLTYIVLVS